MDSTTYSWPLWLRMSTADMVNGEVVCDGCEVCDGCTSTFFVVVVHLPRSVASVAPQVISKCQS